MTPGPPCAASRPARLRPGPHLGRHTRHQLIAIALAGIAGYTGGLIAQPSGTTTHPRDVAIKSTAATALDVAGGAEFGSGDVALIGTDGKINGPLSTTILDDLSGANLTGLNGSQITTGTVAAGRIANLSAAKITSGKLARARLAFGTFDVTGNTSTVATLNRYAFFPNIRGCTASFVTLKGRDALNPTEDHSTGALYIQLDGACQGGATWAVKGSYLSASDRPSVWVVVDGTGALVALWESEDPISVGDTVSPVTADDPTHRAIKIGVPSLAVITALAADLPSAQQADLIAQLDGYAAGERG